MDRVFESLQYEFVNGSLGDDWDILWSIESPHYTDDEKSIAIFGNIRKNPLRQEQKINHYPGNNDLVIKSRMNKANAHLNYILPSFILPKDSKKLEKFLEDNPKAKLVQKNKYNRGVYIVEKDEVIYKDSDDFYQQFMDKPFLIDGHAFDFGVFVLITSFDPLRIYRFDGDVLFRFCRERYHPFDVKIREKYVVE